MLANKLIVGTSLDVDDSDLKTFTLLLEGKYLYIKVFSLIIDTGERQKLSFIMAVLT